MSLKATKKQHAFALAYLETGKPSESYRAAGYKCDRMSEATIATEAKRLLKNPHVAPIIEKAREEARERCAVTVDSLTKKLWDDRQLAHAQGNPMAAVNATMAVAKLHGLADGEGAQAGAGAGPQPEVRSQWAAVRAEIEAARRKRAREEAEPEAGNGANGNGAAPTTDTRR